MDIIKQIKESIASVRQLSILADIPEDRMYKWVNGTSNPKADDITTLEGVFREISDLTKDQIKKLVDERRIGTNKEFEQKLKIATGNKNIKIQGIEELNKLRDKKDVNAGTSNTKGSKLQNPDTQTQEILHMPADFMSALSDCLTIIKEQAITIKEQNRKIPDAPEGERTAKRRAG